MSKTFEDRPKLLKTLNIDCARALFVAARDASADAERDKRQLDAMEQRALSLGGGGFEPRVSSTSDPQRMAKRVDAYVDRSQALQERQDGDYAIIDLACEVLYGRAQDGLTGLASLVPEWWCDVLWWHYLDGATWERTGEMVGYSAARCRQVADVAFDTIDSWGIVDTIRGTPLYDL